MYVAIGYLLSVELLLSVVMWCLCLLAAVSVIQKTKTNIHFYISVPSTYQLGVVCDVRLYWVFISVVLWLVLCGICVWCSLGYSKSEDKRLPSPIRLSALNSFWNTARVLGILWYAVVVYEYDWGVCARRSLSYVVLLCLFIKCVCVCLLCVCVMCVCVCLLCVCVCVSCVMCVSVCVCAHKRKYCQCHHQHW